VSKNIKKEKMKLKIQYTHLQGKKQLLRVYARLFTTKTNFLACAGKHGIYLTEHVKLVSFLQDYMAKFNPNAIDIINP